MSGKPIEWSPMYVDTRTFIFISIAQYAMDNGLDVMLCQNDLKTEVHETLSGTQQVYTDTGLVLRAFQPDSEESDETGMDGNLGGTGE